jgi:hypothetical protein
VPVLAAGLADVLVGHPHPLEALRLEHHLLDQPAVLLLDVGAVAERAACVGDPVGQVVAELLELAQRQQARTAAGGDGELEALARPGGAEELRQLVLEASDLTQQRPPGGALVRGCRRNDKRLNSLLE